MAKAIRDVSQQWSPLLLRIFSSAQALAIAFILFGSFIRCRQYLYNRSLWSDEAALALNIVNRSYAELLQPLDYKQGAPIGFLWLEKLATQLWGNQEYALRLVPLLSSILSLVLIFHLAKKWLLPAAIPIAVLIAATSEEFIIYYATEVKQYSSDMAITLLAFTLAMRIRQGNLSNKQVGLITTGGAILIWFSHAAIFVLMGVAISILVLKVWSKKAINWSQISLIFSSWLTSFFLFYWLSLRPLTQNQDLTNSWDSKGGFPDHPFDVVWLLDGLGKIFYEPLGFVGPMDAVAIVAFLVGCFAFWQRHKTTLLIFLSPLFATIFAGYIHKYPFAGRLLTFLAPFFILIIAEGVAFFLTKPRQKIYLAIGSLLLVLLLYRPVTEASQLLVFPHWNEEIKPVLNYVKTHRQPGDVLYLYHKGKLQFLYYAQRYGFEPGDYILGAEGLEADVEISPAEWQIYQRSLAELKGEERVWILFSHAWVGEERRMLKAYLDQLGEQKQYFAAPSSIEAALSFVYLYDFSQ